LRFILGRSRPEFASNNEFYAFVDTITEKLRSGGFVSDAERLHELVHKIAWTTSTELFGELRIVLKKIRKERAGLPSDLSADIRHAIKCINKTSRRS
jgi:hypothetical protein